MIEQEVFEHNITTLLSHPNYKKISKLVGSDNSWVRLNYKSKERFITPNDSWDDMIDICNTMIKK